MTKALRLAAIPRRSCKLIEPSLSLFGLPDGFWSDGAASCKKLLMQVKTGHGETIPCTIDSLSNFIQVLNHRGNG